MEVGKSRVGIRLRIVMGKKTGVENGMRMRRRKNKRRK